MVMTATTMTQLDSCVFHSALYVSNIHALRANLLSASTLEHEAVVASNYKTPSYPLMSLLEPKWIWLSKNRAFRKVATRLSMVRSLRDLLRPAAGPLRGEASLWQSAKPPSSPP